VSGLAYAGSETIGEIVPEVFSSFNAEIASQFQTANTLYTSLGQQPTQEQLAQAAVTALACLKNLSTLCQSMVAAVGQASSAKGASGVDVFTYEGPVGGLGAAASMALANGAPSGGGAGDASNAIVLLTRNPATWTDMMTFFAGAAGQ
jgi:hypothetical protein